MPWLTRSLRFESVECIVLWNSIARRNELLAPRRPSGKSPDLAPGSGFSLGANANRQICDTLSLLAIRSVRHRGLRRSLEVLNGRATTSPRLALNLEAQGRCAADTRTGMQPSCDLALERNRTGRSPRTDPERGPIEGASVSGLTGPLRGDPSWTDRSGLCKPFPSGNGASRWCQDSSSQRRAPTCEVWEQFGETARWPSRLNENSGR